MKSPGETDSTPSACIRHQKTITQFGQQALKAESLDQLLHDAADAVAETLNSDYCGIFEFSPNNNNAFVRDGVGWQDELAELRSVPLDRNSQIGETQYQEAPVIVTNLATDERFTGLDLFTRHNVTSGINVLVGPPDTPWGVLGIYTIDQRDFTDHEVTFIQSIADILASAIETERPPDSLEGVYNRISDAFFALDNEWRFTYLNDRAHEIINPDDRPLVGNTIWEEFPEAISRKFKSKYEQAMYEQETVSFEEYYPEPLGSWFEVRAYPSETGLSVYFRDITERKKREKDLDLFRTLLDHSTDSVLVIDPETGRYLDVNDTACRRRGYSREELLELSVPDVETEIPDMESWRSFVEDLRAETQLTFEGRHRRKDGTTYPVEVNAAYVELDREYVLGISRDVTERRERERDLQRTKRRFEAIFEDPNILVGLLDPDGTVLDINQTAMEYIDADLEDVTGEQFWETPWWGEGDDVQSDVRRWVERAANGEYVDFEADLIRPNGQQYTLEGAFRPVTNDEGDVVSVIVSDRDVTERKERERALEQSEQRYRTLAENFPNGFVTLFDDDLQYTLAAGQAIEDLSVSADEIEGRTLREVWSDDVADTLEPAYRAALDGEEDSVELSYGGREWIIYTVPITDENGDVFAGMKLAQNITEQIEREQALRKTKNQLRALIELLPVGVFVADKDGQIIQSNEAAKEIWGGEVANAESVAEYDQYTGWWAETGDPVEPDEWALARALRGEEVTDPDLIEIEGFDGERRTILNYGIPVWDADGDVIRAIETHIDITEREEHKQQLQEQNNRLESFASMLAHELRNPLTIGQIYTQQLPEETNSEAVSYITESFDRIEDIIDVMLVLTRGRKAVDEPTVVDIAELSKEVWEDVDTLDATIDIRLDSTIQADETYMQQLFRNLFENAVEHGGRNVTVTVGDLPTGFYVADDGRGISAAERETVFESGYTSATDQGGMGLGLAFVKELANVYEWTCAVTESEDGGARFEFREVDSLS